jgi:hypothetical protein
MAYRLLVDDNYHYMDESERYAVGEFSTLNAAIEAAKKIVDDYLLSAYKKGMTAQELCASYASFGEDPFIMKTPIHEDGILFSARDFARLRCDEICFGNKNQSEKGEIA